MKELEYRDLLLTVWTDPTPGFYSAAGWDEFGRSTPPLQIHMPFDDPRFVGYVDTLDELNPEQLQYVGARLFDSLFQGDLLRLYVHLCEQTRPTETQVLIRLKIDPPNVARLPWECLYDTREAKFLSMNSDVTLVRYVAPRAGEPQPVAPRESPLNLIQLENMTRLARAGASIVPAMPAFYFKPRTFEDLADFVAGRVLSVMGIPHTLFHPWPTSDKRGQV